MLQGVLISGEVKGLIPEAEGKPTSPQQFTRDEVCSLGVIVKDLKPLDLCSARLKPAERWRTARADLQSLGRPGYRGESQSRGALAGSRETTRR